MENSVDVPTAPAQPSAPPAVRRSWRRSLPVVLVALAGLVLVVVGWMAFRALEAATSLQAVADDVRRAEADVRAGRAAGLPAVAADIERNAARAERATSDPVWRLAEMLPVVGPDAVAVRTVADAVDQLATQALTPLAGVAEGLELSALRPVDGQIDLAPLAEASPTLQSASQVVDRVQGEVAALDVDALHAPLTGPVIELQSGLATASEALATASRLATLLPPMLGAEGPRNYLLLFLNSGELRAQGGIVGAVAVITADEGRIELTDHATTTDLPTWDEPVLPLTPAELAVTNDLSGRFIQNTVMIPDTPRAAQLAAEMWRQYSGQTVDGVIAVDPVALSYVLDATGDVQHPDGKVLTPESLVTTLLFDAYAEQTDPSESDAFFASAAAATFDALADGAGDPRDLVDALLRAADERRLSVWSAHPDEQEQISGTAIDGAFLSGGHDDAVGVFFDNTSGWKTDTFLLSDLTTTQARCEDGTQTMDVTLTLTSTLPQDAQSLPFYVVGDGRTGVPVGSIRLQLSVYSPVDGAVEQIRRGDEFLGASGATMAGRDVRVLSETLTAGETATYHFTVSAPARGTEIPVWSTPTTTESGRFFASTGCSPA